MNALAPGTPSKGATGSSQFAKVASCGGYGLVMMVSVSPRLKRSSVLGALHRGLGFAAYRRTIRNSAILGLHSVRALPPSEQFEFTRALAISPEFLETLITDLRSRDIAIVSLAEALARLNAGDPDPFVAITFDDGYADNFHAAFPVFQR